MTGEPFTFDDTQFVVDAINRDTIEQADAILTGLIERGWTPPPASGGLVDSARVHCGHGRLPTEPWTDAQLKLAAVFNVTQCPNCGHSSQWHAWNGCDHQGCACPTVGTADTMLAKANQERANRLAYKRHLADGDNHA